MISLSDGNDILGIFATNDWTTLVLGAAGVALILLSMLPRVGRRPAVVTKTVPEKRVVARDERVVEPAPLGGRFVRKEKSLDDPEPVTMTTTRTGTSNGTLDDRR